MAQRRMISKEIFLSDDFSFDISKDAKLLYTYLILSADDYGITNQLKRCGQNAGLTTAETETAFAELTEHGYLISLEKIVVIKHWHTYNKVQPTRRTETQYKAVLSLLQLDENNVYTLKKNNVDNVSTNCRQNADNMTTQYSTVQCSTVQCSTVECSAVECSGVQGSCRGDGTTATTTAEAVERVPTLDEYNKLMNRLASNEKLTDAEIRQIGLYNDVRRNLRT